MNNLLSWLKLADITYWINKIILIQVINDLFNNLHNKKYN